MSAPADTPIGVRSLFGANSRRGLAGLGIGQQLAWYAARRP